MLTPIARASLRRLVAPSLVSSRVAAVGAVRIAAGLPVLSVLFGPGIEATARAKWLSTTRYLESPAAAAAGKKKAAPKNAKKKTTTKKKTAVKKKAAPKKAPMKKKKKVLTPDQKASLEKRQLRETALLKGKPANLPDNPWLVFLTPKLKGTKGAGEVTTKMKAIAVDFKNITTGQLQALKDTADKNKLSNNANYKAWVESHPPEVILAANAARARLGRKYKAPVRKISDERLPRRPSTSYGLFVKARFATGEYQNEKTTEAFAAVAQEWKTLSAEEKKPYQDLATAEMAKYRSAKKAITG